MQDVRIGGDIDKEVIASGDYEVVVRGKKFPAKAHLAPLHKKPLI